MSAQPNDKGEVSNNDLPSPLLQGYIFELGYLPQNSPLTKGVRGLFFNQIILNSMTLPLQGEDKRELSNTQHPISSSQCYKWLQYRAIIKTTKPETTPVLHSVTINNSGRAVITDTGWTGPDTAPPEIIWRSPTRTENADIPISFRLCDNLGGLGVKSVEAYLDGGKVELLQDKTHGNEYTLKTNGPLKPIDRSRSLSAWRIENYQDALTVEHTSEVITVRSTNKDETYVDTAFKLQSPQIPVRENSKYVLTFFAQHTMELTQLQHWGELSSGIRWKDFRGNDVGAPYRMSFGSRDVNWRRNVHTVKSPAGAASAELCFGWDSPNLKNGDFFSIKNVSLEGPKPELTYAPNLHKIEVKSHDLAGNKMQKTWYVLVKEFPTENIMGPHGRKQLTTPQSPPSQGGDFVASAQSNDKGEVIKDTLPHENMPPTLNPSHRSTELTTKSGRESSSPFAGEGQGEGYFRANTIRLRDDGMTLIDNKPFFPIGIYAVQKSMVNDYNFNNAFKELKEAGFNTAHTYMKERNNDFREFYSTAAQYGMKVVVMTSTGHNSSDIDTIVRDVASEVNQPALLSWYLADDTASHIGSSDLKRVHEAVKDIDPFHLTSQADWVGAENRYKGYVNSTDIFLPELYPIGKNGMRGVPEVINDMNHVKEELRKAGQCKGVWAIVQDFKGWGWERYPTNEELRAMTYLSIIHGATGITYYTYGGWGNNFGAPFDKGVWNNLKKVVGELAYLHNVLAERNTTETCAFQIVKGATKDDLGYPAINTLFKVHQGKRYLFAVNSAKEKTVGRFNPHEKNIPEITVLFEGRSLPVKGGVFVDDFKPYEVHVYQW